MGYYKEDVVKALTTVYPNIGLVPENFGSRMILSFNRIIFDKLICYIYVPFLGKKQHWSYPAARKEFFDSLSQSLSIDSLNPLHWYSHYPRIQSLVSSHKVFIKKITIIIV